MNTMVTTVTERVKQIFPMANSISAELLCTVTGTPFGLDMDPLFSILIKTAGTTCKDHASCIVNDIDWIRGLIKSKQQADVLLGFKTNGVDHNWEIADNFADSKYSAMYAVEIQPETDEGFAVVNLWNLTVS